MDSLFGKKKGISVFKSSEKESIYPYMIYPQNSLSSLWYNIIAIFMIKNINKYHYISYIGVIQLFLLGIISFGWWATQLETIQKLDIVLYSTTILYIGFYSLVVLYPNFDLIISIIFFMLNILLFYLLDIENKKIIKWLNCLGIIFSLSLLSNFINIRNIRYALALIIISFALKLLDGKECLPSCIIGTAYFHTLTSFSIVLIWYTFQ